MVTGTTLRDPQLATCTERPCEAGKLTTSFVPQGAGCRHNQAPGLDCGCEPWLNLETLDQRRWCLMRARMPMKVQILRSAAADLTTMRSVGGGEMSAGRA